MKYIYIPVASFLSHHYPKAISIAGKVFFFCLICVIIVVLVIRCKESFRKRQGLFWLLYLMVASCIRRIKEWLERIKQCLESFKQQEEEKLVIREIYNSLSPEEKGNLKQEFIMSVLKDDPSLYKRYKNDNKIIFINDNKISELFYDEFLRDKLGE
jgi:predicted PurR-regulated permease PerM